MAIDLIHDSDILSMLLDNGIKQGNLEDVKDRFAVSSNGGVGYRLFPHGAPLRVELYSLNEFDMVGQCRNALRRYVENARDYAEENGFEVVEINENGGISSKLMSIGHFYRGGIGAKDIKSLRRLEIFLDLIARKRDSLDETLKEVEDFFSHLKSKSE